MSFLSRMTNFQSAMSPRYGQGLVSGRGIGALAVDKAEKYAAAAGFGFIKGYYREKAMLMGQPVDLVAGLGFTVAGAVLNMYSNGNSKIAPHLERVGDAGMMSYFNSLGAAYGAQSASRMPAAPQVRGLEDVLGELPPAVSGSYLTADEIARYAGVRA